MTWSPDVARNAALLIPLILVNTLAGWSQFGWAEDELAAAGRATAMLAGLGFAAALESVAVYLAYETHAARLAGDAAGWLAAASYAVAGFAATVQYSHWSGQSRTLAMVFAVMSGISPWLWAIRSRSIHRAQLRAAGLIEPRAVKFGRARWALYPGRTFKAFRAAVWAGTVDPSEALRMFDGQSTGAAESTRKDRPETRISPAPTPGPVEARSVTSSTGPAPSGVDPDSSTRPVKRSTPVLRSSRPEKSPVDGRATGSDDVLLAAIESAAKRGEVQPPLSVADVRSVVVAGGTKAKVLRDAANARLNCGQDVDAKDGTQTPESVK